MHLSAKLKCFELSIRLVAVAMLRCKQRPQVQTRISDHGNHLSAEVVDAHCIGFLLALADSTCYVTYEWFEKSLQ